MSRKTITWGSIAIVTGLSVWIGITRGHAGRSESSLLNNLDIEQESELWGFDYSGELDDYATDWKGLIISDDENKRRLGREMLLKEHKETVQYLISVVKAPVQPGESFYEPDTFRNIAIRSLGELRSKEAIPVLVDSIFPKEGHSLVISEELLFSPAGYALIEIGLPTVRSLVECLISKNMLPHKRVIIKMIVRIKGLRETELLLEDLGSSEMNPPKKESFEEARELIQEPKFRKLLENLDTKREHL